MNAEMDPRVLEATLKARRIARDAKLIEIAKGKQPLWVWIVPGILILVFGFLARSGNLKIDVWWYMIAAFAFAGWFGEWRTDRRLDAVVQLLLNVREHPESQRVGPA